MKHKMQNRKSPVGILLALLLIMAAVVSICFVMVSQSNHLITDATEQSLWEVSEQSSSIINQRISVDLESIQMISNNLSLLEETDELRSNYLNNILDNTSFERMQIVDRTGTAMLDGNKLDLSEEPVFREALNGQRGVSHCTGEKYEYMKGNLYAAPYKQKGNIAGAVIGWVPAKKLQRLLSTSTFDGEGFSHIIDADGEFIVRSTHKNAVIDDSNFFHAMKDAGKFQKGSLDLMKTDMGRNNSGNMVFNINGRDEMLEYVPLDKNGWYLLSVVPLSVYAEKINGFTNLTITLSVIISLMFLALIIAILYVNQKNYLSMQKLAYEDPVTGGFTDQRFELDVVERLKKFSPFSMVAIDIRRFKLVNDIFGSDHGDRVLKHVHDSIKKELEAGEAVSRISSDTFNVMLNTVDRQEVENRIQKISENINKYNDNIETPYYLIIDCGVYTVTTPETDLVTISDRANGARKSKKHWHGDDRFTCMFYDDSDWLLMLQEQEMENAMDSALEHGEFVVYLQPKVSLETGKVAGAEALSRWVRPGKDMIYPGDYIPLFERNGFIHKLDLYMFEKVCELLSKWVSEGIEPVPVSVNLSRWHLYVPDFLEQFKKVQQKYNVPSELIEFELTESIVFENVEMLQDIIQSIHQSGFRCSMDDFGSGYSSLNMLKDVPVDVLKLDRGFFLYQNDQRGDDIVKTVILLAKRLGMKTVSEGVETTEQVELLKNAGCDMVQGYVFSRPIPVEEFENRAFGRE